eukprot:UN3335
MFDSFTKQFSKISSNDLAIWEPVYAFARDQALEHYGRPPTPFCERFRDDVCSELVDAVRDAMFMQPVQKAPRLSEGDSCVPSVQTPANAVHRAQKLMSPKAHKALCK